MDRPLNIPLSSQTTRRSNWRVVWMAVIATVTILCAWTLFRVFTHIDSTSNARPSETTHTVQFFKKGRTLPQVQEYLGHKQAFFGEPWTLSDFLEESKRQIAFHYSETELIGITIDSPISEELISDLAQRNFSAYRIRNKTLVQRTTSDAYQKTRSKVNLASLHPRFDGSIYSFENQKATKVRIFFNSYGMVARQGIESDRVPEGDFAIDENLSPKAYFPLTSNNFDLPGVLEQVIADTEIVQVLQNFRSNGGKVLIGQDEAGVAVYIKTQTKLKVDQLAEAAKRIMNRNSVALTSFTLEDGTRISEIRSKKSGVTSTIATDENLDLILLKNDSGSVLRVSRAGDIVTISNREVTSEINPVIIRSSCRTSLQYFVQPSELTKLATEPSISPSTIQYTFYGLFSEIALDERITQFCW